MEDFELEELGFLEEQENPKVLTEEQIKENRVNRINSVLDKIVKQLEKTGVDVPYLKGTAIEAQKKLYDFMYSCALKGYYTNEENDAIIQAHEDAEQFLAITTKLVNDVRRVLFERIDSGYEDIDSDIEYVSSFKITKESITNEVLQSIKERFGV